MKEKIKKAVKEAGAVACGIAEVRDIAAEIAESFRHWIEKGFNASMEYMERNMALRLNPALLLEDHHPNEGDIKPEEKSASESLECSIVMAAFNYSQPLKRNPDLPYIAQFAYGQDYHDVLRFRLRNVLQPLLDPLRIKWRICVDSAPTLERYWAVESGLGYRADNGLIAVPGYGTRILLASIIVGLKLPADGPSSGECYHCGRCRRGCPASALQPDSQVDARRCLSYATIEHRGPWAGITARAMQTQAGKNTLFGCDICQNVCPLNQNTPLTEIEEFLPSETLLSLTAGEILEMDQTQFSKTFKGSAIKRAKLEGLHRNAENLNLKL